MLRGGKITDAMAEGVRDIGDLVNAQRGIESDRITERKVRRDGR